MSVSRMFRRVFAYAPGRASKISLFPSGNDAIRPCWITSLDPPPPGNEQSGWKIHRIFRGPTASMKQFSTHVSVLVSGRLPHAPHEHEEEELLIMLSGEADIMTLYAGSPTAATSRVVPGSIVYHSACQKHTIQSVGPIPATYLIFKWTGTSGQRREPTLKSSIFQSSGFFDDSSSASAGQTARTVIFESPTRYLLKLRCHLTTLLPGAGYPPHADSYDVAILTLSGTVETLGRQVTPSSVIFYAAGEPHGMKNAGTVPARYLVIEFHSSRLRRNRYSLVRKGTHIIRRLFPGPYSLHLW